MNDAALVGTMLAGSVSNLLQTNLVLAVTGAIQILGAITAFLKG